MATNRPQAGIGSAWTCLAAPTICSIRKPSSSIQHRSKRGRISDAVVAAARRQNDGRRCCAGGDGGRRVARSERDVDPHPPPPEEAGAARLPRARNPLSLSPSQGACLHAAGPFLRASGGIRRGRSIHFPFGRFRSPSGSIADSSTAGRRLARARWLVPLPRRQVNPPGETRWSCITWATNF